MVQKGLTKYKESIKQLKEAIDFYFHESDASEKMRFLAVAKAYEVAVEYTWKYLKARVEAENIEVTSPKDAIRQAAQLKIIEGPALWLKYLEVRNSGVHDYFGIPDAEYVLLAQSFLKRCQKINF